MTVATANSPTTLIEAPGVTYMVTLNRRTGFATQESYEAEVQRIVAMFREGGIEPTVRTYEPGEVMGPPCEECGGSGLRYQVNTPRVDHRDPAFDYDEFECTACGGTGVQRDD